MKRPERDLNRTYTIYGSGAWGGCSAVQAKLMEYGVCSYTGWSPSPPRWRFLFDTALSGPELRTLLSDLWARYDIKVEM